MGSMLGKSLGAEICRIQPREEDEARKAVGMIGLEEGEPVAEGPGPRPLVRSLSRRKTTLDTTEALLLPQPLARSMQTPRPLL